MKKLALLAVAFIVLVFTASAQLQIDNQLQMTGGTDAERRITNVGNPAAQNDAVNAGNVQRGSLVFAVASGSGGNYVVSLTPAPTAYVPGMIVNFQANHGNTGAATLKVGSLAAIAIKSGVTSDLSSGDIANNQMVSVIYDGTNFQLLSGATMATTLPPSGPAGGDLTGTYPNPDIAANAVTTAEIANATITSSDLANTGVGAGTFNNVTVNAQGQVTGGNNVSYLTSEGDGSITNEGSLTVGAGAANTSLLQSNTSGSTNVTFSAGAGITLAEPGSNTISITNSSPDQTVSITGAGINVVSGSYPNFTITGTEVDGSVSNEGLLSVGAGTPSTSLIQSNTSGSGTVTLTAGTGLSIGESGNNITMNIANSGVSAGTYTSVTVNAQGQVTGGTNPGFTTGSGSAGHVSYWSSATAQTYDSDANFFWDATNNYLGIGIASPAAKLHLVQPNTAIGLYVTGGNSGVDLARFQRNVGSTGIVGINSSGGNPQVYFDRETASGTWAMGVSAISGDQSFSVAANNAVGTSDYLVIRRATGNVGIGTTVPAEKLDVVGNVRVDAGGILKFRTAASNERGYIKVDDSGVNGGAGLIIATSGGENISFKNGGVSGTEYLVINGLGNVGIGVSPSTKLEVNGGMWVRNIPVMGRGATSWNSLGYEARISGTGSTPPFIVDQDGTSRFAIASNGAVTVNNLAGSGNRAVYANSSGTLTTTAYPAAWQLAYESFFGSDDDGWTLTGITRHTSLNMLYRPFTNTNATTTYATRYIDLSAYPHSQVMIKFRYWFLDSWDGSPNDLGCAKYSTDGTNFSNMWSEYWHVNNNNSTGNQLFSGTYADFPSSERVILSHSTNDLWIRFTGCSALDSTESWGVDNVEVWVK